MDKTNKDTFVRLLKRFCITSIFFTLINIIVTKLLQYNKPIILYNVLLFTLIPSLGCSYGYFKYYKKCSKKVVLEESSDSNIVVKLQDIMKNMHWSAKSIDNEQMVFKSSALITFLTEYLIININENILEFEGPEYYVEKVVEKLHSKIDDPSFSS